MNPIEVGTTALIQKSPQEICAELLDTERWPEFEGFAFLPGIERARFETRTPDLIGSRIRVHNKDGSSHVEEIVEWDVANRVALRFQEFSPPLQHFASHFIETWTFRASSEGTEASRTMAMYPKNFLGWLVLFPISKLMKMAFEKNVERMLPAAPPPPRIGG